MRDLWHGAGTVVTSYAFLVLLGFLGAILAFGLLVEYLTRLEAARRRRERRAEHEDDLVYLRRRVAQGASVAMARAELHQLKHGWDETP